MKPLVDLPTSGLGSKLNSIEAVEFETPDLAISNSGAFHSQVDLTESGLGDPAGTKGRANEPRWWQSQFNLMLAVFSLLSLAALLFVLLAPPPEIDQADYVNLDSEPLIKDSQTPWTQSQQTEARSESQAILSNLLESKKSLEQKRVLDWAPERYQQALDLAAQGDELYQETNFSEAMQTYQDAVSKMDSLYDLLPAIIDARLAEGDIAIKEGKSELARQRYEQALALDEGNLRAGEGLGRATKLDRVLQLLSNAAEKEKEYQESSALESLEAAQGDLQEAFTIDPVFSAVSTSIDRVDQAIVEKRFKLAMSDAYQALFANRYSSARKAFSKALKIKPGNPTAKAALQQSLASDSTATLSTLLADAKKQESQEMWESAQSSYQAVLQRDVNQVSAKLGQIRARARAELNSEIEEVLSDPLSFSQTAQKNKASKVLADARSIKQQGPKLAQQIRQLDTALAVSNTSIKVSLVSDSLTSVSLKKVGSKALKLGQFRNRKMALKPGRYVATGVRVGFHDVRKEIELHPGTDSIKSIQVQCDQAITLSPADSQKNG